MAKEIEKIPTTCKQCRRCVYATDLDRDGYCCFCAQPKAGGQSAPAVASCTDEGKK